MLVLAIESSCDETSLALLDAPDLSQISDLEYLNRVRVLASVVSSQIEIHKQYGGVVPEVGARRHANQIHFIWNELLDQLEDQRLKSEILIKIDKIMVTTHPGLASALRVGHEFAKSIKFFADLEKEKAFKSGILELDQTSPVDIHPINHLRGHMASCFFELGYNS